MSLIVYFLYSYALFEKDGNQIPQELVTEVGEAFESILKEVRFIFYLCFSLVDVSEVYEVEYIVFKPAKA